MKFLKLLAAAVLGAAFFIAPANAQWQVPLNSVPVGQGAGTGFQTTTAGTNNQAFMGNTSAAPGFRALVGADLPNPSASTLGGVQSAAPVGNQWIDSISTSGVPHLSQPTIGNLSAIANNQIVSNVSGGSAAPSANSPTSIWDAFCSSTIGQFWVRMSSAWGCTALGYANPVWWGADPTGSADSASAFNSAIATDLPIKWPKGKFKINSAITTTLANGADCFCMDGVGSNFTTLFWPNASGGIQVTAGNLKNTFHLRDLTLTTSQVGSGNAFKAIGLGCNNGCEWQSDISNVTVQGDDFSASSSQYWTNAVWMHNWGGITVSNLTTNGPHGAPGSAGGGNGLTFEGDNGTTSYATVLNVTASNFNFHANGVVLGSYWQGVTINQSNFNGEEGSSCVAVPSSQTGVLVLVTIMDSQFNCAGSQISFSTAVLNPTLIGNTITVYGNNNLGFSCQLSGCGGLIFIGNIINNAGAFTGNFGVVWNGTGGIVEGNYFTNIANGVNLQANANNTTVIGNAWVTVGTKFIDTPGTNSVGTAAAGHMTGVVP